MPQCDHVQYQNNGAHVSHTMIYLIKMERWRRSTVLGANRLQYVSEAIITQI